METFNGFPYNWLHAIVKNISRQRAEQGLSVRNLQGCFGFESTQAIYKWQNGASFPTVDKLFDLSKILDTLIEGIRV